MRNKKEDEFRVGNIYVTYSKTFDRIKLEIDTGADLEMSLSDFQKIAEWSA